MNETCDNCGCLLGVGVPHECDPGEVEIMRALKLVVEKREAEEEVIAAADAFYDLAHATLPELRMVEQWKEATKRIDKAVQTLRKIRTRERELPK
jgi:hypothetical protein